MQTEPLVVDTITDQEVIEAVASIPRHFSAEQFIFDSEWATYLLKSDITASGPMPVSTSGFHRLKIAASTAEVNTLNDPLGPGLFMVLTAVSVGGSGTRTITYATGFDSTGRTTLIFNAVKQTALLVSVPGATAATYRWELVFFDATTANLPPAQFATGTTTTTFTAGQLTGADFTCYTNTGANPGSIATRTATQMFQDLPNAVPGLSYVLRIINGQATGTLTVTAGSGVTLTGTMTIAGNTWRDFIVTFNTATTLTIQNAGVGTFS